MKKIIYCIIGGLSGILLFLTGFLWQQPKINKLKKQVDALQKDNSKLLSMCEEQQVRFKELLIQHKAFKVFSFKKKAHTEKLHANLVLQYALNEYMLILIKRVKYQQELEKEEIRFFTIMEKVIEGKKISTTDKANIHEFVMIKHKSEIKKLKECDFTPVMKELETA